MSALDFTARALAVRALAQAPLAFSELAQARLPTSVARIESHGFSEPGLGAGSYVADDLANEALHAAHPDAVFAGSAGRYFRLAGDQHGYITPEQLGCPRYSPGTNQRSYIQAAIAYAEAVGLKGVLLPQRKYELWAPIRVYPGNADIYAVGGIYDKTNHTGDFLVIRGRVSLIGTHPLRATLHCKGPTGGSLLTDYQVFETNKIWRGNGIKIASTYGSFTATQPEENLPMCRLENIILFSDAVGERDTTWPATTANPNCWDVCNKGVWFQADYQEGVVRAENFDVIGFLGECIYTGYDETCGFIGRNLVMKHSNAQALNPSGPGVFDIDGLYAENCSWVAEGVAGVRSRIVNARFKNCFAVSNGNGGGIMGSTAYTAPLNADNSQPFLYIEAELDNCGVFYIGPYTYGRLKLIDTRLAVVGLTSTMPVSDIDLDVTVVCHKISLNGALTIAPHVSAPAQSVENVSIRLNAVRSKYARANGHFFNTLIFSYYSLDPNCVVYARSPDFLGVLFSTGAGSQADYRLKVVDEGLNMSGNSSGAQAIAVNVMSNPALEPGLIWNRATFTAASAAQQTAALPSYANYNDGHEYTVEHRDTGAQNATLVVDGRVLLGYRDRVKFKCNRLYGRWDIVEAPKPRKATASIDIASTALGAESGPYTIAVPGCRANMIAQVLPPSTGVAGFVVSAVRADIDQVKFWVRNVDGANPANPAAATWTALVSGTAV